jgi:LPXTG-motif cell wall-anchored protein
MIIAGVLAALCCIGLLLVSSLIPQESITANARVSADYYSSHILFENQIENQSATKRDNYADCISSCIAFHLGNKESNIWKNVLEARFTQEEENVNEGFRRAVYEDAEGNQTYSRYWHGSAAVIRLLYPFMDISAMRIAMLIAGIALSLAWIAYLVLKREYAIATAYLLGTIAIKAVFAFSCFEYAFVCLLVPVFSFLVYFILQERANAPANASEDAAKRPAGMAALRMETIFLIAGILTCFFDFLTAEILTFTIPAFILFVCLERAKDKPFVIIRENEKKDSKGGPLKLLLNIAVSWMAGYAGMFLLKWILTLIFLGKEEFMTAMSVAAQRSVGAVHETNNLASPTVGIVGRIVRILSHNFACLFGLPDSLNANATWLILIGIAAFIGLLWFFLRKKDDTRTGKNAAAQKRKKDTAFFPVYLILMITPVVRFLVLSNHAYMHYFFTYRALMATVTVGSYLFIKTTVLNSLFVLPNRPLPPRNRGAR